VAYSTGTAYGFTIAGNVGDVLVSGGTGSPTWANPSALGTNYWNQENGVLYPKSSTLDFLIGGESTESARFGLINISEGTPTATISAQSGSIYISAAGTIQTTNAQTLRLGGNTTGNIIISAANGS